MLDISEEVKYAKEEWNKTETQKIAEMKQMFRKTVGSNKRQRNHDIHSTKLKVSLSNFTSVGFLCC